MKQFITSMFVVICISLCLSKGYAEITCFSSMKGVVTLELEVRPLTIESSPGVFVDTWGYCIKGEKPAVPGPTIKVKEGTKIRIHFTNRLTISASIHPHVVNSTSDFGAYCTEDPTGIVEAGETGIFDWDTTGAPGTWFYHTLTFGMGGESDSFIGLYGALIVEPEEGACDPPDREFVVFTHALFGNTQEYVRFNNLPSESYAPGELIWKANQGERARFHLINASEEVHTFYSNGHPWIDSISGECIDEISLAPFSSYVADFIAGKDVGPGNWEFIFREHMMNGLSGTFIVEEGKNQLGSVGGLLVAKKRKNYTHTPEVNFWLRDPVKPKTQQSASPEGSSPIYVKTLQEISPEGQPPTLDNYTGTFLYTDPKLKAIYEEFVGLNKGDGPWGDYYSPIPIYQYFNPARHYSPPDSAHYQKLLRTYRPDQCVECHEVASPSIVHEWKMSEHASPKDNTQLAAETREIEELIGKVLNNWTPGTKDGVYCSYCHGEDHDNLFMPTVDNSCGACHPKQAAEFMKGRDFGRPNHPQSWEASVSTPWYAELYRKGEGFLMVGCDQCHQNMSSCDDCHYSHGFSAAQARRPEICSGCHMGPDHPDWESYEHSKWGIIYQTTGDLWNWDKKLSDVIPGIDYPAPTCQYCHMYVGNNQWEMHVESKGIWRMGVIPPMEVDYKSGLKNFPYGIKIPPMDKKLEIYSAENREKRRVWIELCSKCHSNRFATTWLDSLDQYMLESWKRIDEAQLILENLFADGVIKPSPEERPPFPLSDVIPKVLGPDNLGTEMYNLFKKTSGHIPVIGPVLGVYSIFTQTDGNPSGIEREFVEMWFWDHLQGYKGTAHAQQDLSWWWGTAKTGGRLARIQEEASKLRRLKAIEDALIK
ncbi:MAG: multicopper oxidase domain-containing protein [Candidatus Brocadiales bacterium]|nr:multicopper oxidase domain-containing protein [Candidatus Brocadiales bacterium]